jgi:hypothetical protein
MPTILRAGWEGSVAMLAELCADGSEEAGDQMLGDWDEYFGLYRGALVCMWPDLDDKQRARVARVDGEAVKLEARILELTGMSVADAIKWARGLQTKTAADEH